MRGTLGLIVGLCCGAVAVEARTIVEARLHAAQLVVTQTRGEPPEFSARVQLADASGAIVGGRPIDIGPLLSAAERTRCGQCFQDVKTRISIAESVDDLPSPGPTP